MSLVCIGSDHAGYDLKEVVVKALAAEGAQVKDVGCHDTASVDYPDFAKKLAQEVVTSGARGILICGTGIGMSIAANKVSGIRAALCQSEFEAQMSRNHNDANVLCLGARIVGEDLALKIVERFLHSDFEGGRHERRVAKIEAKA